MKSVDRTQVQHILADEEGRFVREHPKTRKLFERAQKTLIGGVPMNWMEDWPGPARRGP